VAAVTDTTGQDCATYRIALGAYVLGSLEPAERSRVERHLTECSACRNVLTDLAVVPGLLSRTTVDDLGAVEVATVPLQAERAVRELNRRRHAARRRNAMAAVAAAAMIVTGVGIGLAVTGSSGGTTVSATSETTHVSARVNIANRTSGTVFSLRLSGVAPGEHCALVAVSRAGDQQTAANWIASYQGKAKVRGESAIRQSDLVSLRVVTATGEQLVSIPVD
jgi:anti-sigma factor RsiW